MIRHDRLRAAFVVGGAWIFVWANAQAAGCSRFTQLPCGDSYFQFCQKTLNDDYSAHRGSLPAPPKIDESAVETTCMCESLGKMRNQEVKCANAPSSVDLEEAKRKQWGTLVAKSLQCDGYVHAPCNEPAYRACVKDLSNSMGCDKKDCGEGGLSILFSCACDNLVSKADRAKETSCALTIPPAELKAIYQKDVLGTQGQQRTR
jgi:hypothetical protein